MDRHAFANVIVEVVERAPEMMLAGCTVSAKECYKLDLHRAAGAKAYFQSIGIWGDHAVSHT